MPNANITKGQDWEATYGTEEIGEITSMSNSISADMKDVNSFDVNAINRYIKGRSDVTISMSMFYDPTNQAQQDLLDASILPANTPEGLVIQTKAFESGDPYFSAAAFVTSAELSFEDDEPTTLDVEFQISETFTITYVP